MHLAYGTNSWSSRGKLSKWLQLCTQPQETPLGSNKHRNKCTKQGLKKEHVPIKQAVMFPAPPSHWALPCLAQLDSNSGDELADHMAKLKTLLGGKTEVLGVGVGCSSGLTPSSTSPAAPYQQQQPSSHGDAASPSEGCTLVRGTPAAWAQQSPQSTHWVKVALKKTDLGFDDEFTEPLPAGFCICLFARENDEMMDLIALQCRSTSADVAWLLPSQAGWHQPLLLCPRNVPPTNESTHRTSLPLGRVGRGAGWTLLTPSPMARYKHCRSGGCTQGVYLGCSTLSREQRSSTRAAVKLCGMMSPCEEVTFGQRRDQGHQAVIQPRAELPRG